MRRGATARKLSLLEAPSGFSAPVSDISQTWGKPRPSRSPEPMFGYRRLKTKDLLGSFGNSLSLIVGGFSAPKQSKLPPSKIHCGPLSRAGHESLSLAFCLATRRCMNLSPSFSQLIKGDAGAPRPNALLTARKFPQYSK
jgi:hypothetical protein